MNQALKSKKNSEYTTKRKNIFDINVFLYVQRFFRNTKERLS